MQPTLGVIELSFDPAFDIGNLTLRWQTVGVTVALLVTLGAAARRTRGSDLRLADLVLIVCGAVPGAVIGGRIVHGLVFPEAYLAQPATLLDPSVGSLSLLGSVLGGTASAAYIAHLVGAPVRRWADLAAAPLLVALGLGKIAQLLGGSGQGLAFFAPWAVAFPGDGPWVDVRSDMPSHPSQLYEALFLLVGVPIVVRYSRRIREQLPIGGLFIVALAWFLLGRVLIGFTWRDDRLMGPLNLEQVLAALLLGGVALALGLLSGRSRLLLGRS